eukprot:gene457-6868_t
MNDQERIKEFEVSVKILKSELDDERKKRRKLEAIVSKLETAVDVHEVILEKLEKTVPKTPLLSDSKSDDED